MWILLSDCTFSIVDAVTEGRSNPDYLLVRSRQDGAIERHFGRTAEKTLDADYKWRARIKRTEVATVLGRQCDRLDYPNFKASVDKSTAKGRELHHAYTRCWTALAQCQHPAPHSEHFAEPTATDTAHTQHRRQQPMPKRGSKKWQAMLAAHRPAFLDLGIDSPERA
jgi:hypothetical protein